MQKVWYKGTRLLNHKRSSVQTDIFKTIRLDEPEHPRTTSYFDGVSVLIPCCHKIKYIRDTVKSVLNQTVKPDNIIILWMEGGAFKPDFGPSVTIIEHNPIDVCSARNLLVEKCPTSHFVFLDADDVLMPTFIEQTIKWKECGAVFGLYAWCNKYMEPNEASWRIGIGRCYPLFANNTGLWAKECFNNLGGFDPSLKDGNEDIDLNTRLIRSDWAVKTIEDVLWLYRGETDSSFVYTDACTNTCNHMRKNREWILEHTLGLNEEVTELFSRDFTPEDIDYIYDKYLADFEPEDLPGAQKFFEKERRKKV